MPRQAALKARRKTQELAEAAQKPDDDVTTDMADDDEIDVKPVISAPKRGKGRGRPKKQEEDDPDFGGTAVSPKKKGRGRGRKRAKAPSPEQDENEEEPDENGDVDGNMDDGDPDFDGEQDEEPDDENDEDFDVPASKRARKSKEKTGPVIDAKKGDFIVMKEDLKKEKYKIWRIDTGKLIEKFLPFNRDEQILHKATSSFSSLLFKKPCSLVEVEMIEAGERDIVMVKEGWVKKLREDEKIEVTETGEEDTGEPTDEPVENGDTGDVEGDEDDEEGEPDEDDEDDDEPGEDADESTDAVLGDDLEVKFQTFLQSLVANALDEEHLNRMLQKQEGVFIKAITLVDERLTNKLSTLVNKSNIAWNPDAKAAIERLSNLEVSETGDSGEQQVLPCQVCANCQKYSVRKLSLSGIAYDRNTLIMTGAQEEEKEFTACETVADFVEEYHRVYHFKIKLLMKCHDKLEAEQNDEEEQSEGDDSMNASRLNENKDFQMEMFLNFKNIIGSD